MEFFKAVIAGDTGKVGVMLAAEPSLVHARDEESGATPLHFAAEANQRSIVKLLVEHGGDINARDLKWGATPKGWAVEYLISLGALLATEMDYFIDLVRSGNVDAVAKILKRTPHFARATDAEGTALTHATVTGNPEMIKLIRTHTKAD